MVNYRQTFSKAGVIGGVTLGTYLGMEGLEHIVNNPSFREVIDLGQSVITSLLPYKMADKYMRGQDDSPYVRYGIQVASMVFGVPEMLKDVGNLLPAGSFKDGYFRTLKEYIGYIRFAAAVIPFLNGAKRVLNRGL